MLGFLRRRVREGVVAIVILVIGVLAGAVIGPGFLDLFNMDLGLMRWLLAAVGGVVGFVLIRRAREGSQDWGIIILAGLVGALLSRGADYLAAVPTRRGRHPDCHRAGGRQHRIPGRIPGKRKAAAQVPAVTDNQ